MVTSQAGSLSGYIREKAYSLGFDLCGIAAPRPLNEHRAVLEKWCSMGMHDRMDYLSRDPGKRTDPGSLFPATKSVVVTALNYYTDKIQREPGVPVISRYAFGRDYHYFITGRLKELLRFVKDSEPGAEGKIFVDSGPLMEKPWAVEAGLGWQGRHSIVINRDIGSFFFIGILLLNVELEPDDPCRTEGCGSCSLCIGECPTGAINHDGTIDARRCIANLTIENRGPIPGNLLPLVGRRVYGCDRCQEVCPRNANAKPHNHPELSISDELAGMTRDQWQSLTEEKFLALFKGTPVERVKFDRFRLNISAVLSRG